MSRAASNALVAAIAAFVVGAFSVDAKADGPFSTYGVSPRTKGMGGAQTASASGWEAAFYNPAGLSSLKAGAFSVGAGLVLPNLHIDLDQSRPAEDPFAPRTPAPHAATTWGFGFPFQGFLEDRLFFGFALSLPAFITTYATTPDPAVPFHYRYDTYDDHYDVVLGFSVKWFDFLSTGLGARIGGGQVGRLDVAADVLRRRYTYQSLTANQYSIFAPTAGFIVGPLGVDGIANIRAGFSYRDRLSTPMDLPADIDLDGFDLNIAVPIVGDTNFSPRTFSGGLALGLFDLATLSVDVDYRLWSEASPPFLTTSIDISGEDTEAIGFEDGLDLPGPGQNRVDPVAFVNTWTTRVGLEVKPVGDLLALRVGYGYRPTPVPDQTTGTNIVDNTAHVLSAGLGLAIPLPLLAHPVQLAASYQLQVLQPRRTEKAAADDDIGGWTSWGTVSEAAASLEYAF